MFEAIYHGELEDALEAGHLSVPEFLRHFRERCGLVFCDLRAYLMGQGVNVG